MDAVEFLKESSRMCEAFDSCCDRESGEICELYVKSNEKGLTCPEYVSAYPEEAVAIVEKWAKDHPRQTRQSEFLKMFPNALIFKEILAINPCAIDSSRFGIEECHAYDDNNAGCFACRKKYWLEEIE